VSYAAEPVAKLAALPDHVPPSLVTEFDFFNPLDAERDLHQAWKKLQDGPPVVFTPHNGGHWIATNGDTVREIYSDPTRFSSENIWLPKEAGEKYEMVPTRMDPPVHGIRPVTSFISEDLPQPDGPTTAANSPRATLSVVPSSASVPSGPP